MLSNGSYQAVTEKVIPDGRHGPYAVARCAAIGGLVTFSLKSPTWKKQVYPEPGTYVVLSEVTKKRAGWRAAKARFFEPADEKQSSN